MPEVVRLSTTPVKSLALHHPEELWIGPRGVEHDRRVLLVDERARLVNGLRYPALVRARASFDGAVLRVRPPEGPEVAGPIELGEPVAVDWEVGYEIAGREVRGPFAGALSGLVGFPLRLLRADDERAAWSHYPVSLAGSASIDALRPGGLDPRRFRMLVEVAGTEPFAEDGWAGRRMRIGAAIVAVRAACRRCVTTNRDPATGVTDFNSMRALAALRGRVELGVYAAVERPGLVRVGDPVQPL